MKMLIFLLALSFSSCLKKVEEPITAGIEGSWNLRPLCKQLSSGSMNVNYIFTASNFEQSSVIYTDLNCMTKGLTVKVTGTYISGYTKVNTFEDQTEIDFILQTMDITLNSSVLVSSYNSVSYCGYNDWQLNVPKNILGRTCDGTTMANAGAVEYSIYRKVKLGTIDSIIHIQTYPGDIYFGTSDSTHDGKTVAQRYVAGTLSYLYAK